MELSIENLGPISSAKIKIKKLNIILGKNGSGKTYLAKSIFSIFQYLSVSSMDLFNENEGLFRFFFFHSRFTVNPRLHYFRFSLNDKSELIKINENYPISYKKIEEYFSKARRSFFNSSDFQEEFKKRILELFKIYCNYEKFSNQIHKTYLQTLDELSQNKEIIIELNLNHMQLKFSKTNYNIKANLKNVEIKNLSSRVEVKYGKENLTIDKNEKSDIKSILHFIELWVFMLILQSIQRKINFLPAARSGLLQNYRFISSSIIRFAPDIALGRQEIPRIPDHINEFLANVVEVGNISVNKNKKFRNIVKLIEKELLQGKILREKKKQEIIYQTDNVKIQLSAASSMISEIAPLLIYLQNSIQKGNILIIEEPESHLHPSAQRIMAKILVKIANSGVNVIVTSHSDYFLNQINNLIAASNLKNIESLPFEKDEVISPEDVGIYHFVSMSNGYVLENLPIDENGLNEDYFTEIVQNLYDETLEIESLIEKEEKTNSLRPYQ